VKQAFQSGPIATLNSGEHIADRGHLLRHGQLTPGCLVMHRIAAAVAMSQTIFRGLVGRRS
jgi:hypothetical protein